MRTLRAFLIGFALCGAVAPASATTILALVITTAKSAQVTAPVQFSRGRPLSVGVQCNFTYGSGGTSADAYVQTSVDFGATWNDVANCHFTTSSARFAYNLSALTPVTTEYTPTDGSITANTSKDGVIGPLWRVKWTSVGTYAGSTTLNVDIQTNIGSPGP